MNAAEMNQVERMVFRNIDKWTENLFGEMVDFVANEIDDAIEEGLTLREAVDLVGQATSGSMLEPAFFNWCDMFLDQHEDYDEEDFDDFVV